MKLKSILTTALCGMLALAPCADTFAKGKGPPSKGSASHGKKSSNASGHSRVASKSSSGPRSGPSRVVHSRGTSKSRPQAHIARSGPSHGTRHVSPRHVSPRHVSPRHVSPRHHDPRRHVVTRHRAPYLHHARPYFRMLPYASSWVTPVSYGVSAADVQRALAEQGFYYGPIDGVIGPMTRSAIANFQAEAGLTVTGSINTSLVQALGL